MGLLSSYFVFFFFLFGFVWSTTTIEFRLRRYDSDQNRWIVFSHAGHPERLLPLTVTFAVPRRLHSESFWGESATQGDLPGLYAALYVEASDRAIVTDLEPPDLPLDDTDAPALFSAPTLRLVSTGKEHYWTCNVTPSTLLDPGVPLSPRTRGLLMLGPGSAVWLKVRYMHLTASSLVLTDEAPALLSSTKRQELRCKGRDEKGRCILDTSPHYRMMYANGTSHAFSLAGRIILDLDSTSTLLPGTLAAEISYAASVESLKSARMSYATSNSPFLLTLMTRVTDIYPDLTRTSGPPNYVVAEPQDEDGTLIIGRTLAQHLFSEMVYDSSEAVWVMEIADESTAYDEVVRAVIALSILVQGFLIAQEVLRPDHLLVRHVFHPTLRRTDERLWDGGRRRLVFSVVLCVVALVQLIMGQAYLGHGTLVDGVLMRDFGIYNMVFTGVFFIVLVGTTLHVFRGKETPSIEFLANVAYVHVGLGGSIAAFLPRAMQGVGELVCVAVLASLQLFLLVYLFLGSSIVIYMRWRLPPKNALPSRTFRVTMVLWCVVSLVSLGLFFAMLFGGTHAIIAEADDKFNTQHDATHSQNFATFVVSIIVLAGAFLMDGETLDSYRLFLKEVREKSK